MSKRYGVNVGTGNQASGHERVDAAAVRKMTPDSSTPPRRRASRRRGRAERFGGSPTFLPPCATTHSSHSAAGPLGLIASLGKPNSLGNTVAVVADVLAHPNAFDELFACYFDEDELVRLRVSNAMKRIAAKRPELLVPYLDRFLDEVAYIPQASTQWTLAQLLLTYRGRLCSRESSISPEQYATAVTYSGAGPLHPIPS